MQVLREDLARRTSKSCGPCTGLADLRTAAWTAASSGQSAYTSSKTSMHSKQSHAPSSPRSPDGTPMNRLPSSSNTMISIDSGSSSPFSSPTLNRTASSTPGLERTTVKRRARNLLRDYYGLNGLGVDSAAGRDPLSIGAVESRSIASSWRSQY